MSNRTPSWFAPLTFFAPSRTDSVLHEVYNAGRSVGSDATPGFLGHADIPNVAMSGAVTAGVEGDCLS
jgi:hypothetical protein